MDSHDLHDVVKKDDDEKMILFYVKAMSIDFFINQRIEFAQCPIDETLPNFIKRKHPQKGREKETKCKDQSPGRQKRAPKRRPTGGKWNL